VFLVSACEAQCRLDFPEHVSNYDAMIACGEQVCGVECGFEPPPPPECLSNADCPGTTKPSCLANGKCGYCNDATGCVGRPEGPNCTPLTGTCGKCLGATTCTDSTVEKVCNSETGACGTCATNNDCALATKLPGNTHAVCDVGTHTCRGCFETAECPDFAPWCDSFHQCSTCAQNADCAGSPFGPRCLPGGTCGPCKENADCTGHPDGSVCRADHTCGSCASNADCRQTSQKPAITCFASGGCGHCSDDAACVGAPGGAKCTHQNLGYTNGECVECLGNADCKSPGKPTCTANVCVP
jgi:hypothetical protein